MKQNKKLRVLDAEDQTGSLIFELLKTGMIDELDRHLICDI